MSPQKPFGQTIVKDQYGNSIKAKTKGQYDLIQAIDKYDILFVNGPAGTGKTFLATCKAVAGLQNGEYERICLSRPAMESGEELGFLPGSLEDKIAPYMKPLYDSIDKLTPKSKKASGENQSRKKRRGPQDHSDSIVEEVEWVNKIEISPLAYMRGLTLDNSFIILDEAQNTTPTQMQLILTRLGWGSKLVITGDASQSDMDRRLTSGFRHAQKILKGINGLGFIQLDENDIVRHKIIKDIIKRYDKQDSYRNYVYSNKDNYDDLSQSVPDEYLETHT